jgi:hypothetical protein
MLCEYEPYCEFVKTIVTQPPIAENNKPKPLPLQPFPSLKLGKITKNTKDILDKVALPKFLTPSNMQNAFEANFNKNSYKFTTTLNDVLYDFATQTNVFGGNGKETSFYEQFVEYCLERNDLDYEIFLDFADYVRYLNRFVFANNLMWICEGYCVTYDGTVEAKLFGNDYLVYQILKFCK